MSFNIDLVNLYPNNLGQRWKELLFSILPFKLMPMSFFVSLKKTQKMHGRYHKKIIYAN